MRSGQLFLCVLIGLPLWGKEAFTASKIPGYMDAGNPFVYQALGDALVKEANERSYEGAFDTQLNLQYDDKRYPASEGTFQKAELRKPITNGIEFSLAYRNAQGVQEYNNIKTGKDGEILSGIKIPVFSVMHDISRREVDLQTSRILSAQARYEAEAKVLALYKEIYGAYYQMLFYGEIVASEETLLKKAQKNDRFVAKEIAAGKRAEISRMESRSLVVQRRQRVLNARMLFVQAKNIFLQYIGMDAKYFEKRYRIPRLPRGTGRIPSLSKVLAGAQQKRPEFKGIDEKLKKIGLHKRFNELSAYPKFDVNLYGAYDMQYREGYKLSLDFNLPIERNAYKGKREALQKERLLAQSAKETVALGIRMRISTILQKIRMTQDAIDFSKKEQQMVRSLEKAEMRKYREGLSQLLFVNQREIATLQATQKLLKYYYELNLLKVALAYERGDYPVERIWHRR